MSITGKISSSGEITGVLNVAANKATIRGTISTTKFYKGTGIESIDYNSDYTLTINLTDGTSYTTGIIRGETGKGIRTAYLNNDNTLTIVFDDETTYITPSIKGDKGNGIKSITKTGTSGRVDTYTITMDDNSTSSFNVTNGEDARYVHMEIDSNGHLIYTSTDNVDVGFSLANGRLIMEVNE